MAKSRQDEYVSVYYGIHIDTCEVGNVWITKNGKISGSFGSHHLLPGRNIISEMIIVFGMSDVISFHPGMLQEEFAKEAIKNLKVKAIEMKKAKTVS